MTTNDKTYRVEGMTCANCAAKFERNVAALPSVTSATVNFGASKIYVQGTPTIEELENAGAFENIAVYDDQSHQKTQQYETPKNLTLFEKVKQFFINNQTLWFSTILILFGYLSQWLHPADTLMSPLLFVTAVVISGWSLIKEGLRNLLHFDFDMRTLMTIAAIGGVLIGEWGEVAVVVILFALSESLERFSMDKARESMASLMKMAPDTATILRQEQLIDIPVEDVNVGDLLFVKAGQKIALDGIVRSGQATINQAAITGESIPVEKTTGDEVFAGTLNQDGHLEIEVTKASDETTIAKVIALVEEAQINKAPAQAFIERFARYYTPLIMLIALGVAIIPPLVTGMNWYDWIYQGLSVLVVGCPCALIISTPVSIVSGISTAAKNGVLIKGGIHLETLSKIKTMAFDKTGTLTQGSPNVVNVVPLTERSDFESVMARVAALEQTTQHPLARAIVAYVEDAGITMNQTVEQVQTLTGQGIHGIFRQHKMTIGQPQLFESELTQDVHKQIEMQQQLGRTVVLVKQDDTLCLLIALQDQVRPQSKKVIAQLSKLGITKRVMLTGDHAFTAKTIGDEVGITDIYANLMPEDKLKYIEQLAEVQPVGMVGDGVNDAPALAYANVGIAMGGASADTALETADIALLSDDMSKLPYAVRLSRLTMRTIKWNVGIALGLKFLALLLVIPGWLTLWIAIMSDMGATLLVTLNAMRLLYVKDVTSH
ncbi:cadmium-translocating P-type ATPase [Staphylococcus muscae]|uniref:Cd(2+)-exporting ATPase n=1 Tax=Staphylococcus muscae TaxID=1294 RepID=A0A240C256_9STAP|nr:heavy metal translocating P-type ATPase [Staphylococcus muscae]AVQ32903.1 cadmium-translocating P-type ATPase [Staphylococcus muscae]PNZ06037.1 cadmium-translocating P-type ATPase [Staphylococcus muscae]GGA80196.1 copper-translocating P-type ATPase [Staphylococcus muscae]SNW01995.1 cadmium-translocating P-type ATPase [Staphylococcus muscae]